MNPTPLMAELNRLLITLAVEGDDLKVRAPKGVLTVELRETIREHKGQLIEALKLEQPGEDDDLFTYLSLQIREGGFYYHHFQAVRGYARRMLPTEQYAELERSWRARLQ
jgi:hypothetical protein